MAGTDQNRGSDRNRYKARRRNRAIAIPPRPLERLSEPHRLSGDILSGSSESPHRRYWRQCSPSAGDDPGTIRSSLGQRTSTWLVVSITARSADHTRSLAWLVVVGLRWPPVLLTWLARACQTEPSPKVEPGEAGWLTGPRKQPPRPGKKNPGQDESIPRLAQVAGQR